MKVLVCGGRDYAGESYAFARLDSIHGKTPIKIVIEGGASGADAIARKWARSRGVLVATVPALWDRRGRGAGPQRNAGMLLLGPDLVLAFPGGRGTANMVQQAKDAGVWVVELTTKGEVAC